MEISEKLLCKYKLWRILFLADLLYGISGMGMLTKKRTHRTLSYKTSATHLVVANQLFFAHVGLPNLFTFCWLSGGERCQSAACFQSMTRRKGLGSNVQTF
jgi:hypothetical protein